jgi:hypothetical protein
MSPDHRLLKQHITASLVKQLEKRTSVLRLMTFLLVIVTTHPGRMVSHPCDNLLTAFSPCLADQYVQRLVVSED